VSGVTYVCGITRTPIHFLGVHVEHMFSFLCHPLSLQHTATHCNTLQHTATHCNTLQHMSNTCSRFCVIHSLTRCMKCLIHLLHDSRTRDTTHTHLPVRKTLTTRHHVFHSLTTPPPPHDYSFYIDGFRNAVVTCARG